jgi:hypothetical protein
VQFLSLDVHPDGNAETCFTKEDDYRYGDAVRCHACGAFVSMLTWLPPFRVELELYGKQFGDFAFGPGEDFLVSQAFREVYYQYGLTGLTGFDPVEAIKITAKSRRKIESRPPMYFRVQAGYGQTALDLAASGFEWLEQPTCSHCYTATIVRWKRLVLEEGTWTGEDIFRPRGMAGETMVSQRFKDACQRHAIKNAVFTPAEASGHDFYPGTVTPMFKAPQ